MKKTKKITQTQAVKWGNIRNRGQNYYAITRGAFGMGLTALVGLILLEILFDHLLEESIYSLAGEAVIAIPGFLIGGYIFGRQIWNNSEKMYEATNTEDKE